MRTKSEWHWPWEKPKPDPMRPPKVGGTRAPATIRTIDFTKPHDFHFRIGYDKGEPTIFKRCLLIGFTTPMGDDSGDNRFEEFTHNRWIVLQHEDGRLAYVPRDGLVYIEEHLATEL